MTDLHITWPDGDRRFSPDDSPVEIGRSSKAAVPLAEGSVSRQHLSIAWTGDLWQVTDNSTHGTFGHDGNRLARQWNLTNEVAMRLGGTRGIEVQLGLSPTAQTSRPLFEDQEPQTFGTPNSLFPDSPAPAAEPAKASPVERVPDPLSFQSDGRLLGGVADAPGVSEPPRNQAVAEAPPLVRLESDPNDDSPLLALSPSGPEDRQDFGPGPAGTMGPNTTIINDATLRINVGGQDYSFLPGAEVTVGRDPSCLVQLDEQHSLVSRRHLHISHHDGHWWLDDHSSKGTYIDHKQIKGPYKAEGAFLVNLGDDDAGTPMRVITAGEHRSPRNRILLLVGVLAVLALAAVGALAAVLASRSSDPVEPDFTAAKNSTVMLFGLDGGQGSGFFVADDLILTNQHVAVLSPQLLVGVSRQADEPARIEYATELVANHPFLDIAVIRVTNPATITEEGPVISDDPVGEVGLPPVSIGDSDNVTIGDPVFSTGFPGRLTITSTDETGALRLPSVVATSGEAVNFTIWPGCSNPGSAAFIPADSPPGVACSADGDIERGVLLSTFSSGQGASGSAVFHNGEVVAVVYAGSADEDNASLNIATSAFDEWLDTLLTTEG